MRPWCKWQVLAVLLFGCSTVQAVEVFDYARVLEKGYEYVDPRPESEYVAPETRVLIRFKGTSPANLSNLSSFIQVVGQESGLHIGTTTIASDGRTVVFQPEEPFVANEAVDVSLVPLGSWSPTKLVEPIEYRFYVLRPASGPLTLHDAAGSQLLAAGHRSAPLEVTPLASVLDEPIVMSNGVSVPRDFPQVNVTVNRHPGEGFLFMEYARVPHYALILDNWGAPVWYRRGKGGQDFRVQPNGMITETQYVGYDLNFNRVKEFHATNGYQTDSHELQVLEDGSYLLLGLRTIRNVDMSQVVEGGRPSAMVHETCVQEFTSDDELIFQWRSWENYEVADIGPEDVENVRGSSVRVSHLNAIDVDEDGHILVSSRHLSDITKIHRQTGEVLWRLGGPNSDFVFVDDPLNGFSCQHDIRVVGPDRYTLFDNGNDHDPPVSRAVEYELDADPNVMTATLVWEYRANPDRYAYHQGSAQRLPNGNTLINFALPEYPKVTEVNPSGEIEFEMDFVEPTGAYRVGRFPWTGVVEKPYLILEPNFDKITLLFNKFGDPDVAYYRVYGGLDPHPETLMATSEQTLVHLRDLENGRRYYFRVTAVDLDGNESAFSNEESLVVYLYDPSRPSANLIVNGDFSQGQAGWALSRADSADAQWTVEDGRAHVKIEAGGQERRNIRLVQSGLRLAEGESYVLSFEAGTKASRVIEVKINKKNVGSFWDYSKMGPVYLSAARQDLVMKRFTHTFVMKWTTDLDACIEIHAGSERADVYLDNLSLIRQAR